MSNRAIIAGNLFFNCYVFENLASLAASKILILFEKQFFKNILFALNFRWSLKAH